MKTLGAPKLSKFDSLQTKDCKLTFETWASIITGGVQLLYIPPFAIIFFW